jgi:putative ABC transport system permease protein
VNHLQRIAFRNVRLNWRHSLAAILSIAGSFFALVVFQGYIKNVTNLYYESYRYRSMFGDVLIENQKLKTKEGRGDPFSYFLAQPEQDFIKDFIAQHKDEVHSTIRALFVQGLITNGRTTTLFIGKGHDLEQGLKMRDKFWAWNVMYGQPLALANDPAGLSVGQALGAILDCTPVHPEKVAAPGGGYFPVDRPFECYRRDLQLTVTTESGQLNALNLNVGSIMDGGYQDIDNKLVSMSLENAQALMNTQKITHQTIRLNEAGHTADFISSFQAAAHDKFPDLKMQRWQDHSTGELYNKTLSLLTIFRNFVIAVIVTISCLSVLNTMVKVVKERTREIGTLLSLGFRKSEVMQIFLAEAFFLALMGCVIGIAIALILTFVINHTPIYYKAGLLSQPVLFQISFSALSYLVSLLLLLGLTVTTAYFACRGTLRQKIVECLTHV